MSNQEVTHRRLQTDFNFFSRHCLKIMTKDGSIHPFMFNKAQEYLHSEIEKQKNATGMVRVLIVKGRQQGCSTYTEGRFYHGGICNQHKNIYILSHLATTTRELFEMVDRFYLESPESIRPNRDIANGNTFKFKEIGTKYGVGTAGNDKVGRGGTVQYFHGSEVAFWEKTEGLETGILQSVADIPGTEIILESTANGMKGFFYEKCMDALQGRGDYKLIFIPWYWQPEYRRVTPPDGNEGLINNEQFGDEGEYKELYGLDMKQIYWRRAKIITLKSLWKFRQEYPAHVMEAFQTSGATLIDAEAIQKARKSKVEDKKAPLVLGVDPGRNKDRTVIAPRQGRQMLEPIILDFKGQEQVQMQIAGKIAQIINQRSPQKVFIDVGEGWGVVDRLREQGYRDIVEGVLFGSSSLEPDIFINKRAEMWCSLRDYVHGEEGEVSMPDRDDIQADFMSMPEEKVTSSGKIKMVEKETIKKEFGMSPDIGDAYALTFAFPVQSESLFHRKDQKFKKKNLQKSSITTLQRVRKHNKITSEGTSINWFTKGRK